MKQTSKGDVSGLELGEEQNKQEWLPSLLRGTVCVDEEVNLLCGSLFSVEVIDG